MSVVRQQAVAGWCCGPNSAISLRRTSTVEDRTAGQQQPGLGARRSAGPLQQRATASVRKSYMAQAPCLSNRSPASVVPTVVGEMRAPGVSPLDPKPAGVAVPRVQRRDAMCSRPEMAGLHKRVQGLRSTCLRGESPAMLISLGCSSRGLGGPRANGGGHRVARQQQAPGAHAQDSPGKLLSTCVGAAEPVRGRRDPTTSG